MPSPSTEPVAFSAALQAVVSAVLGLLTVFDVWTPTDAQTAAIFLTYTAVISLLAVVVRSKVTPTVKLQSGQQG